MSTGNQTSQGRAANLTYRGVMANAVTAERKVLSVASDLFRLARKCEDLDEFLAKTQMEEEWVLSEEAGQMQCVEVPRCWTQAKSDIKGAFSAGLDLTKIPSYHKMKIAKAEANKAKQNGGNKEEINGDENSQSNKAEAPTPPDTPAATPDGNGSDQAVRPPKHGTSGAERETKPDDSLAEALANGSVVDAKSTELTPPKFRELVKLLARLDERSELQCQRRVKEFIKSVQDDLSRIGVERKKGGKQQHVAS